jgi:hypothetical protein
MEMADPLYTRQKELMPVVSYAVKRRIETGEPDYWDRAMRLELAVLAEDPQGASDALADALASTRELWESETTLRNLRSLRETRERRGAEVDLTSKSRRYFCFS